LALAGLTALVIATAATAKVRRDVRINVAALPGTFVS
jgi:hypothetical protein